MVRPGYLLFVWMLPLAVGCCAHQRMPLEAAAVEPCRSMPGDCRNKVYVVLLHGFDPSDSSALSPLRESLNNLGFNRTFHGHWYHVGDFADEIIRRRDVEPDSRVVIVGSGMGVEPAHELAERLGRSGVEVASLFAIDAPFWAPWAYSKPANVDRVRYMRKTGSWSLGETEQAEVVDVDPTNATTLASEPQVAMAVIEEVAQQSRQVSHQPSRLGRLAFANPAPTPNRLAIARGPDDAWDYLQPVAKLPPPGAAANGSNWTVAKPKAD